MVFNVRLGFRRRTGSQPDRSKAVLFIKAAGRKVLLMRVQFKSGETELLGLADQSAANAGSLNLG